MPDFYTPPENLYFRLLGVVSQRVLVSRRSPDPGFFHYPVYEKYDDQYFSLIHSTGSHSGRYAIRGKVSGYVLYSRNHDEPRVGHVSEDGKFSNNWFTLERGTGKHEGTFRLICPETNTIVFLRTSQKPQLSNLYNTGEVYDDQFFSFLFEDTEVVRVEYDLAHGKIADMRPVVLSTQTLTNTSDSEQEMEFSFTASETHSSSWESSYGFTITAGTTFQASIPFVSSAEMNLELSASMTWAYGRESQFAKEWSVKFTTKAGPGKSVHSESSVTRGHLDVPYTIVLRSKANGVEVKTHGTWKGVSTWDLRHKVSPAEK